MEMRIVLPPRPAAGHILIIMHDFPAGGTERIAIRLANRWAKAGRRVSILCGVAEGPARALVDPEVAVVSIWPPIPRSLASRIALGSAFAACIETLSPDIIFAPGNFHIPVMAVIARILGDRRPAMVCKLSNPLVINGLIAPLRQAWAWLTRSSAASIDAVIAMSVALRDEAVGVLHRSDIRLIYEPNLDVIEAKPSLSRTEERTILCAGRLVPQKNMALAIQAFALLDRALDARLVIVGDGNERVRLEVLVDRLGLNDRVTFRGHMTDIRPALAKARLFVLSSRYEGYPAVLVEALAAGVPCVTTDSSPAIEEIMSSPDFGRVVPQEACAIARAMEDLLRKPREDAIDASQLFARHDIGGVSTQYLTMFDEVVAAKSARATGLMPMRLPRSE
jgi:glycosyltransferase involved in cell wall biosynthesis